MHDLCLVYHICHADVECEEFKNFLKGGLVKFVIVAFTNNKRVLGWIGLVVANPFELQKNRLLPSRGPPSMLTLAVGFGVPETIERFELWGAHEELSLPSLPAKRSYGLAQ